MTPQITLIRKSGQNALISKRISLDERGAVRSDGSQCLMAQGTAIRASADTANALAKHIEACGSDQAIALGALKAGLPDCATITLPGRMKDNPGAITRSRDFIDYRPGEPAWALIDFDTKGMPDSVSAAIKAAGGCGMCSCRLHLDWNGQRAFRGRARAPGYSAVILERRYQALEGSTSTFW
jgi:hypothetical protein